MTDAGAAPEPARGEPSVGLFGPRLAALGVLALGIVLIVAAFGIARGGGYTVIGPATIPLVVAVGLLLLGVGMLARTTVVPDFDLAELAAKEEADCYWPTVGWVAAVLIGYAVALDGVELGPVEVPGLGYIVATAIFLPLTARILGSTSPVRDAVIGLALGAVVYFGFTEFLGVRLPPGILAPVL